MLDTNWVLIDRKLLKLLNWNCAKKVFTDLFAIAVNVFLANCSIIFVVYIVFFSMHVWGTTKGKKIPEYKISNLSIDKQIDCSEMSFRIDKSRIIILFSKFNPINPTTNISILRLTFCGGPARRRSPKLISKFQSQK